MPMLATDLKLIWFENFKENILEIFEQCFEDSDNLHNKGMMENQYKLKILFATRKPEGLVIPCHIIFWLSDY